MSEGLEILHLIHNRKGCLLSELALELGIPTSSVSSWISMLCSTGYLKKDDEISTDHSCKKNGMKCICCSCSCETRENNNQIRVELTKRGISLIGRRGNEKTGSEVIPGNGRLPGNNICA
ncbi:helix-turn-helix domain-containing protein [Methanospirillum sp.]|uniref:helix-turn-helix domain-containing protein n=1 Tax=Methanospirillum sp. TaxID=45200 RepID=UPI0035A199FB